MTGEPQDRQAAIQEIRSIVQRFDLKLDDLAGVFAGDPDLQSERAGLLSRILAILGAIFVFSGIAVFVSLNWGVMNSGERIVATLGSGVVAFVLALLADQEPRYRRAAPSLFVVGAVLQPLGLLVALGELSPGTNRHLAALSVSAVMVVQYGLVFSLKRYAALLFMLTHFVLWFFGTAFDWLNIDEKLIAIGLGTCTLAYCAGLDRTRYSRITPFWYFAGSIAFYLGYYELVENSLVEPIFLAVASGGVFLAAVVKSQTLLTVSTVAILAYIAEFTAEHFADSLGWPIVLVLTGTMLIVLSGVAMRVNRKYISGRTDG